KGCEPTVTLATCHTATAAAAKRDTSCCYQLVTRARRHLGPLSVVCASDLRLLSDAKWPQDIACRQEGAGSRARAGRRGRYARTRRADLCRTKWWVRR